jgi:hypothetical protein
LGNLLDFLKAESSVFQMVDVMAVLKVVLLVLNLGESLAVQ